MEGESAKKSLQFRWKQYENIFVYTGPKKHDFKNLRPWFCKKTMDKTIGYC